VKYADNTKRFSRRCWCSWGRDQKELDEAKWRQLELLAIVATHSGEGENWLNMDQVGWVQLVNDGEQIAGGGKSAHATLSWPVPGRSQR
jgi:hypothetical protein